MDICSLSIGLTNLKKPEIFKWPNSNAFSCFANNEFCVAVIWILVLILDRSKSTATKMYTILCVCVGGACFYTYSIQKDLKESKIDSRFGSKRYYTESLSSLRLYASPTDNVR